MKISYNWLSEYVDIPQTPDDLAEALSLVGFEVDDVEHIGGDLDGVVVGRVMSRDNHPNADKLSVCAVDVGAEAPLSIICGAPNVAAGQTVAVATIGATLPNGMAIRKARIRGVSSHGMICSEAELGFSDDSDGIWVLGDDLPLGVPLARALSIRKDAVLDIGVTPNRPDALSHIGIAREVAAMTGNPLRKPEVSVPESEEAAADHVAVDIECPDGCPRYAARLIRGVTIGPSPDWMAQRLLAVGMRPINMVVDITNYVMLETGHPMHAFDYHRLAGGRIVVREAREGETFVTLDDKERTLRAGTVMICDAEKAVAIGGIMGGQNSEVGDDTTDILLESAYFHPDSIRRSQRYLGIHSEAAQRFARGADPNGALYAMERATQLFAELAGGTVARGVVDAYPAPVKPRRIHLDAERINRLLGTDLSAAAMGDLLAKIDIAVTDDTVIAPTFRPDLERTADLAEEVGRLYGYDNIPTAALSVQPYDNPGNPFDDFIDELKGIMAGAGLQEVQTNSMIAVAEYEALTGQPVYPILNPISADLDGMRNSLVPGLLNVIRWNQNRQVADLRIFELGRIFEHPGSTRTAPKEHRRLVAALAGRRVGDVWHGSSQVFDFFDVKGLFEFLRSKFSLDNIQLFDYDNFAVENQVLAIRSGAVELGYMGQVTGSLQRHFDVETPVFILDLDVTALYELRRTGRQYTEIPRYPFVERDLAVVVDRALPVGEVLDAARREAGRYLTRLVLFDIYSGKQIAGDKKSIAFRMRFQSAEKTLTEGEVSEATDRVLKTLESTFNATLRS